MRVTSVLVLAAFLGSGQAIQLKNTSRASQISLAECEAAHKTTGQVLAGCENFIQVKSSAAPQQIMSQNNQAPAMPKAPATAAQKPMPTAQAVPAQG